MDAATFISGTQMKGSDVTDPNPRKSKYLKTLSGGFGVDANGAYYVAYFDLLKAFEKPMDVKIELMNPLDKKSH